jgi:hypothetical protein
MAPIDLRSWKILDELLAKNLARLGSGGYLIVDSLIAPDARFGGERRHKIFREGLRGSRRLHNACCIDESQLAIPLNWSPECFLMFTTRNHARSIRLVRPTTLLCRRGIKQKPIVAERSIKQGKLPARKHLHDTYSNALAERLKATEVWDWGGKGKQMKKGFDHHRVNVVSAELCSKPCFTNSFLLVFNILISNNEWRPVRRRSAIHRTHLEAACWLRSH